MVRCKSLLCQVFQGKRGKLVWLHPYRVPGLVHTCSENENYCENSIHRRKRLKTQNDRVDGSENVIFFSSKHWASFVMFWEKHVAVIWINSSNQITFCFAEPRWPRSSREPPEESWFPAWISLSAGNIVILEGSCVAVRSLYLVIVLSLRLRGR